MSTHNQTIVFTIPRSNTDAIFQEYKNGNWKLTISNLTTNESKTIERTMDKKLMFKVIKELIKNPNDSSNKNNFKASCQLLKLKVE